MDLECIKEPKDGLVKFDHDVLEFIRKENNLDNKDNRENAISIIQEWIKQQDHLVKKDFSKGYIERCIVTCKGSLERTKKQIDKMCSMRTLIPSYFQIIDLKKSEIADFIDMVEIALLPKLTDEYYRVILLKVKPNFVIKSAYELTLLYKLSVFVTEYMKSHDYCRGYILIDDIYDINVADLLTKIDIVELQQFIRILMEGYGCRIKGIYMVTASKFIESFIKLIRPMLPEKIGNRIQAVTSRRLIPNLMQVNVLPEDYGGPEKPIKLLHENLIDSLTSAPVQALMKEMNAAKTDESKRQLDKFNEEYMGMPGTFRTLNID